MLLAPLVAKSVHDLVILLDMNHHIAAWQGIFHIVRFSFIPNCLRSTEFGAKQDPDLQSLTERRETHRVAAG